MLKIARKRFYGGGHQGKYIRVIFIYIAVNFQISSSGKTFEYSKFLIQIKYSSHPYTIVMFIVRLLDDDSCTIG